MKAAANSMQVPITTAAGSSFDKRAQRSIRRKIFRGARHAMGVPRESLNPTAKHFDAIGADK